MAKPATKTFDVAGFLSQMIPRENIVQYRPNEPIYKVGDPTDKVYFLQRGMVKITVDTEGGDQAILPIVLAGEFFGQASLGPRETRIATATALDHATVISIKEYIHHNLTANHPEYRQAFDLDLLNRVSQLEFGLLERDLLKAEKRLMRLLLRLADFHRAAGAIPNISQETLAGMIGADRAPVNRFMNRFRNEGLVSYDYLEAIKVNSSLLEAKLRESSDDKED